MLYGLCAFALFMSAAYEGWNINEASAHFIFHMEVPATTWLNFSNGRISCPPRGTSIVIVPYGISTSMLGRNIQIGVRAFALSMSAIYVG